MTSKTYLVLGLFLLACIGFAVPVLYQYETFQMAWHDHGHLFSMITNFTKLGSLYSLEVKSDLMRSHLDIMLIPMSYLLHLAPSFVFYLLLHCLALAACCAVVFFIADRILNDRWLACLVALIFVLNPYVMAINLYTHFEVFGMLLLFLFALAMLHQRFWWASLALLGALLTKQDFFLYAVLVVLLVCPLKHWRWGSVYVGLSLAYFLIVVQWLWPTLHPDYRPFHFSIWNHGSSVFDVAWHLVTNPLQAVQPAMTGHGLDFQRLFLLLPMLAGPRYLVALAPLVLWTNATEVNRATLAYYYSYPGLVTFFLVLPFALRRLVGWMAKISPNKRFMPAMIALLVVAALANLYGHFGWLPDGLKVGPHLTRVLGVPKTSRHEMVHGFIDKHLRQSSSKSVMTQFYLATYIPAHHDLKLLWVDHSLVEDPKQRPDLIVIDGLYTGFYTQVSQLIIALNGSDAYRTVEAADHFYIWAKKDLTVSRN